MNSRQYFRLSFQIFTLSILLNLSSSWQFSSQTEDHHCAQVFFQPSFQGQSLFVKDQEQYPDLSHIHQLLNNYKPEVDQTSLAQDGTNDWSFTVKPGCTLKLSPTTYLKGEPLEFSGDEKSLLLKPMSMACECPKSCSCSNIKLRKSECGRAYLQDDCSNCNALFTPFKLGTGEAFDFPDKWKSDVKTIILRKGCQIDIRTQEYGLAQFTSSSKTIFGGNEIEEVGGIKSYSCTCSPGAHFDEPTDEESSTSEHENYPPLVDIPRTKGGINTLLFTEQLRRHPGLFSSLQSLRHRRSSRNAYVLLLGLTGSGKSSTINLLFDHPNITKVGDYLSTTTDIHQFTIPVPIPELGMKNTALHVIDTPGIADTRGFSHDAQFLATLEEFLDKHDDLKRRLPNVVLVFSKFTDNRYRGEGSHFVRMLRTLDLFKDRLIDKAATNVIFVLTHYLSETKDTVKDPRARVQSIREVIEEFSTLPRPIHIILAENKAEEAQLPILNGFWKLPNGEFYPKNLFDQMQRSLIECEDPVGEAVVRQAFSNSDDFDISRKRFPLVKASNSKVTKFLGILASFTKPVKGTEVSTKLEDAYSLIDPQVKRNYPDILGTLQRNLHRKSLHSLHNLPKTSMGVMKLLEEVPLNPLTLQLLESAFNITVPEFKQDFVVGSGYSLVSDRTLPAKIFDLGETPNIPSDILFRIPDAYHVEVVHNLDNHIQVFTARDKFISGRMKALGLSPEVFPQNSYNSNPKSHAGFNLISLDEDGSIPWNELSATVNFYMFHISLTEKAQFAPEFLQKLENLQPLNTSNLENVQRWRNFFDIYGTHVVVQAFGGGSIQVKVQVTNETLTNSEKFAYLSDIMSGIVQQLANELIGKNSAYEPPPGVKYEFTQLGGNRAHFWRNFSESDETRNIDDWKGTLHYEPIILRSRMQLFSISEVISKLGYSDVANMIEEAGAKLLNASLVHIPVRSSSGDNPESRDNLSGSMGRGDFEAMQQFSEMFKMISVANQDMQQKMFQLMAQSQAKREQEEQRYQDQLLRLKEEEAQKERDLKEEKIRQEDMEFKRQMLEIERQDKENALRLQLEKDRQERELLQMQILQQIEAQGKQTMLEFMNAERERNTQIMIAQMNQKGWFDKLLDAGSNFFKSMGQAASSVLPAAMMASG